MYIIMVYSSYTKFGKAKYTIGVVSHIACYIVSEADPLCTNSLAQKLGVGVAYCLPYNGMFTLIIVK